MQHAVGASILEIITESLYDNPIVVFREYVQNSADSLSKVEDCSYSSELAIKIWINQDKLFFIDNGTGIPSEEFNDRMITIANSPKRRTENIGYKGIGRLSGLSYCEQLSFINIIDYSSGNFQRLDIDCNKYSGLRKSGKINDYDFSSLINQISTSSETLTQEEFKELIGNNHCLFDHRNTGFLVIMTGISPVMVSTLNDKKLNDNLSWLLPLPYCDELLSATEKGYGQLFESLSSEPAFSSSDSIAAKGYSIFLNDEQLFRPLNTSFFRDYLCVSSLGEYAVCIHSFSHSGISIDKGNAFSGIRIYIDNILLCDENELIPTLQQFGLLSHTTNETIQAVRGIGAAIYIVDKKNISTNARRTFIDVTDEDSLTFLTLISEYVENVFQARYSLSNYYSAAKKSERTSNELRELKDRAQDSLIKLASQEIKIEDADNPTQKFDELKDSEKRRILKSTLTKELNTMIKRFLDQYPDGTPETCVDDFMNWIKANRLIG